MLLCCCCPESTLEDHIAAAVQQHKPRLAHRSGREPLSCLSRMAEHPLSNPPQSRDPHGCHTVPHRDQTAAHLLIQLLRHVRSNNKAVRSLPQTVHEWQRPMINKKLFTPAVSWGGPPSTTSVTRCPGGGHTQGTPSHDNNPNTLRTSSQTNVLGGGLLRGSWDLVNRLYLGL